MRRERAYYVPWIHAPFSVLGIVRGYGERSDDAAGCWLWEFESQGSLFTRESIWEEWKVEMVVVGTWSYLLLFLVLQLFFPFSFPLPLLLLLSLLTSIRCSLWHTDTHRSDKEDKMSVWYDNKEWTVTGKINRIVHFWVLTQQDEETEQ